MSVVLSDLSDFLKSLSSEETCPDITRVIISHEQCAARDEQLNRNVRSIKAFPSCAESSGEFSL